MEHRQLRIFRVLARTLSFTRAAAELGYVQSNVTAQVQALERELGTSANRCCRRISACSTGWAVGWC